MRILHPLTAQSHSSPPECRGALGRTGGVKRKKNGRWKILNWKKKPARNFVYLVGQIKFLPPKEIEIEKLNLIMEENSYFFFFSHKKVIDCEIYKHHMKQAVLRNLSRMFPATPYLGNRVKGRKGSIFKSQESVLCQNSICPRAQLSKAL